jgi:hypothetical protein
MCAMLTGPFHELASHHCFPVVVDFAVTDARQPFLASMQTLRFFLALIAYALVQCH